MPKISVIVPVYKVEKYINRCIDSILNQTYKDFELILIDDGSPDKSPYICDEYEENHDFIHVIHQKNGGLSCARNTGISWAFNNSDSDWITFIDSDDWIHPRYLELLIEANLKFSTQISLSMVDFIDEYKRPCELPSAIDFQSVRPEDIYYNNSFDATAACARLYKKEFFKTVSFPLGKWHEDTFTTYKLYFSVDKLAVINHKLYYYFQNSESIVHASWNPKKMDLFEALENQLIFFKNSNNNEMYDFVLNRYIHNLTRNMREIMNDDKFKHYYKILEKKLKLALKTNKTKLNMSFKKDFHIYKYAYPIRSRIYRKLLPYFERKK